MRKLFIGKDKTPENTWATPGPPKQDWNVQIIAQDNIEQLMNFNFKKIAVKKKVV